MNTKDYNRIYTLSKRVMDKIKGFYEINGSYKTIQKYDSEVLKLNNPVLSTMFASTVNGSNIKACEKIVLEWKIPYQCYEFVRTVPNADIEAHRKINVNSDDVDTIDWFARYINSIAGECLDVDSGAIVSYRYLAFLLKNNLVNSLTEEEKVLAHNLVNCYYNDENNHSSIKK